MTDAITVSEIYMDTPDAVALTVLDGLPTKGNTIPVYQDESATAYNTNVLRNNPRDGGASQYCRVIGHNKSKLRFSDILATVFLDRTAAKNPANWPTIGGRTVTKVYYSNTPHDHASISTAGTILQATMRHTLILELSGNLPEGTYTIGNTAAAIPNTSFTFSATSTRAGAIHATQNGHRPGDLWKVAVLATRRTGGPNNGAKELATAYGISTFNILDRNKSVVFTGNVVLKSGPSDTEPGYTNIDVADAARELSIIAMTTANPCEIQFSTAHGMTTNDKLRLRGISGKTGPDEVTAYAVTVTATDKVTIPVAAAGTLTTGTYAAAGYENKAYPCFSSNRHGTYCYWMDYSAFNSVGLFYIQIPGLGISDPFRIDEAIHNKFLAQAHKGLYVQRRGIAIDVGTYQRGANFRDDGVTSVQNYLSLVPAAFAVENASNGNSPEFDSGMAAYKPNITATRVTLPSSGWATQDAGDIDSIMTDHAPPYYAIMQLLHETPLASRHTGFFTVAKSASAINPVRYAGTDSWPELMHEVAWWVDFWLSMQNADGSIPSGLGMGVSYAQTPPEQENSGDFRGTNSEGWLNQYDPAGTGYRVYGYLYAPDHWSNFWGAVVLGKFAMLCYEYGNTTLGDTYKAAALKAYNWGQDVYDHLKGDRVVLTGGSGTYTKGETVTGGTSGATATVWVGGGTTIQVINRVGSFTASETIVGGTSAASRSFSSITVNAAFDINYYYGTTLGLKALAVQPPRVPTAVNSTTDIVTLTASHLFVTGHKCRVVGTPPGGLSVLTDYFLNVSGDNVSFHTNASDAATALNKVNITTTTISWQVHRCLTDTEFSNFITLPSFGIQQKVDVMKEAADGVMFRLMGPVDGPAYASYFVPGVPNASGYGLDAQMEYMRAPYGSAAAKAYYSPGIKQGFDLDYLTQPNLSFPQSGGYTFPSTLWSPTDPKNVGRMVLALFIALRPGDGTTTVDTTVRDKCLKELQAQAAATLGMNYVNLCFTRGLGVINQTIMLHEDSFSLGVDPPDGTTPYAYFLWPLSGIVTNIGGNVGPLNWLGENVIPSLSGHAYKVFEPWKYARPYWDCYASVRGLIYQSEYAIGTNLVPMIQLAFAVDKWDGNTATTLTPDVHYVWRFGAKAA